MGYKWSGSYLHLYGARLVSRKLVETVSGEFSSPCFIYMPARFVDRICVVPDLLGVAQKTPSKPWDPFSPCLLWFPHQDVFGLLPEQKLNAKMQIWGLFSKSPFADNGVSPWKEQIWASIFTHLQAKFFHLLFLCNRDCMGVTEDRVYPFVLTAGRD